MHRRGVDPPGCSSTPPPRTRFSSHILITRVCFRPEPAPLKTHFGVNGEVCWRGRRTMKWDQRAADLINPVNEEKTKEAETQLEIRNTVQSWYQNSAGFSFRGSSTVRAKQDSATERVGPLSYLKSVHTLLLLYLFCGISTKVLKTLWMRKLKNDKQFI